MLIDKKRLLNFRAFASLSGLTSESTYVWKRQYAERFLAKSFMIEAVFVVLQLIKVPHDWIYRIYVFRKTIL